MDIKGEILCIPGENKNYAIEFQFIKEICSDILVSKVPCLPEYFLGVFHYRGSIIPVLSLKANEEISNEEKKPAVLVIEYQKYQFGLLLQGEPYMVQADTMIPIETSEQEDGLASGIWIGKAFYEYGDALYSLGDIEKMMDSLMIYHA